MLTTNYQQLPTTLPDHHATDHPSTKTQLMADCPIGHPISDSASAAPPIAPRISSVPSLLNTILLCIMSVAADALAVSAWQKLKVTIFPFSFILALLFVIRPAFFYPEFLPATLKNASGIISDDPSAIGSYPRNH